MYNSFSCGFDWHFPSEWGCRTSFHVLICHLCIFFGEMSVQIFLLPPHTFLISSFVFSLNSYLYSEYVWLILWFANIFFHFVTYLFILLMVSYKEQKFFILIRSIQFIAFFSFCVLCFLMLCLQTLYIRSKRSLSSFLLEVFSLRF